MNLTISQDNSRTETINPSIIDKLYEIAFAASSDPNSTVSLTGRLESPKGYKVKIDWLNTNFSPDLTITVPTSGLYILFADSNVESALISGGFSADGIGVSLTDAANANLEETFKNNTTITSFPEFKYFTRANTNPTRDMFNGCTNLENVDFSNVTALSTREFRGAGITGNLNIPNLLSCSGEAQFEASKISNVSNLGSITSTTMYMFNHCPNLTTVTLSSAIVELGQMSFSAYNLSYTKVFTTITGIENVERLGLSVFINQPNLDLDLTNINKITHVGHRVFLDCKKVKGVVNWPNLTTICGNDGGLFYNTAITKVLSLGKIDYIPAYCFYKDNSSINKDKLTEVYLPYECTSIGNVSFYNCTGLTTLKQYTLSVDNWVEGQTPTYTTIGRVTTFSLSCFYNCTSLSLSNADVTNATSIGQYAFYGCIGLTGSLTFPNILNIDSYAFQGCSNVLEIDLGENLTSIGRQAFWNSGIKTFIFRSTTPPTFDTGGSSTFLNNMLGVTIYVPDNSVTTYKGLWSSMESYITSLTNYNPS